MFSKTSVKAAVETLTAELKRDDKFYQTYQSNIAMSFYDAVNEELAKRGRSLNDTELKDLHRVANVAADKFMRLWIGIPDPHHIRLMKNVRESIDDLFKDDTLSKEQLAEAVQALEKIKEDTENKITSLYGETPVKEIPETTTQ